MEKNMGTLSRIITLLLLVTTLTCLTPTTANASSPVSFSITVPIGTTVYYKTHPLWGNPVHYRITCTATKKESLWGTKEFLICLVERMDKNTWKVFAQDSIPGNTFSPDEPYYRPVIEWYPQDSFLRKATPKTMTISGWTFDLERIENHQ